MSLDGEVTRATLLGKLRGRLLLVSAPRFEMALIVRATATLGFLASRGMLALGLRSLALRYACAVVVAYGGFLLLVWIWLLVKTNRFEPDGDLSDAVDTLDAVSGSWDTPHTPTSEASLSDLDLPGEELAVVVALVAATCVGVVAAGYVVYAAPGLLAEVLLDGTLSYGLYRRLRKVERHHWLESAVGGTWLPATAVTISFVVAGGVMQWYAPEASSIGEVFQGLTSSE
jgi:hypothetical protein